MRCLAMQPGTSVEALDVRVAPHVGVAQCVAGQCGCAAVIQFSVEAVEAIRAVPPYMLSILAKTKHMEGFKEDIPVFLLLIRSPSQSSTSHASHEYGR